MSPTVQRKAGVDEKLKPNDSNVTPHAAPSPNPWSPRSILDQLPPPRNLIAGAAPACIIDTT
ncbi:hypothetical protein HU200_035709 [Digitaria exilis]|uniref:Uncharacterized protein n=1 Tax=Digitaria exilis TaxID=1010633 RepID=A0A835EPP3_9POAL|nr:hypothetical protein HU200_035709 [Digitaria exilis]